MNEDNRSRLAQAVVAIENHRYVGFYDWYGIGELMAAAREVVVNA